MTPAEPCQRHAQNARKEGRPVFDVVYPNATHAFDSENLPPLGVFMAGAAWAGGTTLAYDPEAHKASEEEVRRFLEQHLKR